MDKWGIRMAATATLAMLVGLGASACGADEDEPSAGDETTSVAEEPTQDTEEPEEAGDGAGTEGHPAWALPVTTPGEQIAAVELDDVTVEVYQVGTDTAPEDGRFVDPDSGEPILKQGDDIVFLNYVITNNGDPIDLGSSLVDVTAKYEDWQWLQGMDSVLDDDLYEKHDVNKRELAPDGYSESGVYTLGSGESFSYGAAYAHQAGSSITFTAGYVPVDDQGELLHDAKAEAEAEATIT